MRLQTKAEPYGKKMTWDKLEQAMVPHGPLAAFRAHDCGPIGPQVPVVNRSYCANSQWTRGDATRWNCPSHRRRPMNTLAHIYVWSKDDRPSAWETVSLAPDPIVEARLASMQEDARKAVRSASQLHDSGHRYGSDLALGVASNFELAGRLTVELAAQPEYIRNALVDPRQLLTFVLNMSRRGLTHIGWLVLVCDRDDHLTTELAALATPISHASDHGECDRMIELLALAREREQQAPQDGPTRALPRQTRAGPAGEDPEHPARDNRLLILAPSPVSPADSQILPFPSRLLSPGHRRPTDHPAERRSSDA